jgi:hypothetical protein
MQLNVSVFSPATLAAAAHNHELSDSGFVHVHCDAAHCGLGGDDSWSRSVHDAHLVRPGDGPWRIDLLILPLARGQSTPDESSLYRRIVQIHETSLHTAV